MKMNQIGNFKISIEMIRNPECHSATLKIMGSMIIVRAEQVFAGDCIEYTAISEYFDEVQLGSIAPDYELLLTKSCGEITVDAIRLDQ